MPQYGTPPFVPADRSGQDPNSIFDQFGNMRVRDRSYNPDPRVSQALPTGPRIDINANVNNAPPGSALDAYYKRMVDLMPSNRQSALGDLSSVLGGYSSGEKANRVTQGDFQTKYDQMMLNSQNQRNQLGQTSQSDYDKLKLLSAADKRDSNSDAMQKMQLGSYLQQGGLGGGKLSHLASVSDAERTAGGSLIEQMQGQLNAPAYEPTKFTPNDTFTPMDPSKYAKPGLMEKIGSYGGAITGGLGALDRLTGGKSGDYLAGLGGKIPGLSRFVGGSSAPGWMAGNIGAGGGVGPMPPGMTNAGGVMGNVLGKALPIAGIASGGYGLTKDRGLGGNMLNGAQAGAGIGTLMGGPIGTLIGGGIGAGVGALRGIGGGPSAAEKAARQTTDGAFQEIIAGATPEQRAEAAASGWAKPDQALASIVLRDQLGPEQGDQIMQQLFKASRG